MKFDISEWKEKLQQKPIQKEVRKKKEKSKAKSLAKQEINLMSLQKLLINTVSKDKKAKHVMKQRDRGILMILGSLIVGFGAYVLLYEPASEQQQLIELSYTESQQRVMDIQTQLDNQVTLTKNIANYDAKLQEYKLKYPNYRTENEILKVVEEVLAKESLSPATFVKGAKKQALKSTIYNFAQNKDLTSLLGNEAYFNTNNATESYNQNDGTEIPEADRSNFEYTEVSFSVNDITKAQGIQLMDRFYEYERVVIPESWKLLSSGSDGKYRLEATVLFFAYRDQQEAEPLF